MIYIWEFAQGSFLNVAWKNAANQFNQNVDYLYYDNLKNILSASPQNSLSVKLIYYLDYLTLRKKR